MISRFVRAIAVSFIAFGIVSIAYDLSRHSLFAFPQVNQTVPDFSLPDLNGKIWHLSDFKGNFVFLNFWATWCPPCREEFMDMEYLNEALAPKSFTMIAVSVDKSAKDIRDFLKTLPKKPTFLILLDKDNSVANAKYGTFQFPETYLINPKGRLLKKYIGKELWMSPSILGELDTFFFEKQE